MMSNGVIIATSAEFIADVLRDMVRDLAGGAVMVVRNEDELLRRINTMYPRLVFLENCFRGAGTEEFILRTVKRNQDVRIVVWSVMAVKPVIAARYILAGAESYFSLRDHREEKVADILSRIVRGQRYCPAEVKAITESETYFPDMTGKLRMREIDTMKLCITKRSNL
jgi:DNA-binding NarL/FixJ family response regulator